MTTHNSLEVGPSWTGASLCPLCVLGDLTGPGPEQGSGCFFSKKMSSITAPPGLLCCLCPWPLALGLRWALTALSLLLVGFSRWHKITLGEQKPFLFSTSDPQAPHKPWYSTPFHRGVPFPTSPAVRPRTLPSDPRPPPSLWISLLLSHGPKFFLDEAFLFRVFTHHFFRLWV